jgi:glycosyltransferase involved in cell wall biosynthesis
VRIGMVGLKGVPFAAGIENFTEQIGSRLAGRGHEVTVYVRPYVKVGAEYRGMRIRHLPSINTKHLDTLTHTIVASLDTLFADLDIVHYHALGPSVFSWVPRVRGRKTVAHVHGLDWQRAKWSPFASACLRAAEWGAMYGPDRTIAISTTLKRYLEEKYRRPVDYVPTGVETYEYTEPREILQWGLKRDGYILFLSRLVPEKGCHHLIEAYSALATDKPLVIAGAGTHTDAYEASLRRHASPRIIFTGEVKGRLLQELFSNAYVYVLPSEVEGLAHTILQALSYGRCVLASDIEPNVEALGECGVTFRSRDVAHLRNTLQQLLNDPELVRTAAAHGRDRVRTHYSWETVVDSLEAIYTRCHDAASPRPAVSPTH